MRLHASLATVLLGLVSLKYVPVSFTETIKSTAPFFTVLFAWALLGERHSASVIASLVPIVSGLVLCSVHEVRFDVIGFWAAVCSNCIESLQNVCSKRLLSASYGSQELQFYTSTAALLLQAPIWFIWWSPLEQLARIGRVEVRLMKETCLSAALTRAARLCSLSRLGCCCWTGSLTTCKACLPTWS